MGTYEENYLDSFKPGRGGIIGPTEWYAEVEAKDGIINIGGVDIPYLEDMGGTAHVYVNKLVHAGSDRDGKIMEIHLAVHDGLANLDDERRQREAEDHPLGHMAYWRMDGMFDDEFLLEDVGLTEEELAEMDREIAVWKAEANILDGLLDEK